jgi:hypothetical protein
MRSDRSQQTGQLRRWLAYARQLCGDRVLPGGEHGQRTSSRQRGRGRQDAVKTCRVLDGDALRRGVAAASVAAADRSEGDRRRFADAELGRARRPSGPAAFPAVELGGIRPAGGPLEVTVDGAQLGLRP